VKVISKSDQVKKKRKIEVAEPVVTSTKIEEEKTGEVFSNLEKIIQRQEQQGKILEGLLYLEQMLNQASPTSEQSTNSFPPLPLYSNSFLFCSFLPFISR
jgi:hypothetical protein